MRWFSWLSFLVVLPAVLASELPNELVIETTHMPDVCTEKAESGDFIKVHYVRVIPFTRIDKKLKHVVMISADRKAH